MITGALHRECVWVSLCRCLCSCLCLSIYIKHPRHLSLYGRVLTLDFFYSAVAVASGNRKICINKILHRAAQKAVMRIKLTRRDFVDDWISPCVCGCRSVMMTALHETNACCISRNAWPLENWQKIIIILHYERTKVRKKPYQTLIENQFLFVWFLTPLNRTQNLDCAGARHGEKQLSKCAMIHSCERRRRFHRAIFMNIAFYVCICK